MQTVCANESGVKEKERARDANRRVGWSAQGLREGAAASGDARANLGGHPAPRPPGAPPPPWLVPGNPNRGIVRAPHSTTRCMGCSWLGLFDTTWTSYPWNAHLDAHLHDTRLSNLGDLGLING